MFPNESLDCEFVSEVVFPKLKENSSLADGAGPDVLPHGNDYGPRWTFAFPGPDPRITRSRPCGFLNEKKAEMQGQSFLLFGRPLVPDEQRGS